MSASPHAILTVTLPDIGEGVVEGEVIAWLKQPGDTVAQDEPVVVVMTDKATVELPAPQPGKIVKHYYKVGEISLRDQPLYDIELLYAEPTAEPVIEAASAQKALASPAVRKLAKELEVDINQVPYSGKHVSKSDLARFKTPQTPIPRFEGDREEPLTGIRHLMAEKMTESVRTIPQFSYFEQADVSRLVSMRAKMAKEAQKESLQITYMPFFIRALSLCIESFPLFNASLDIAKGVIVYHKPHNIGIAMAAPYGLIVPVLKAIENLTLPELIRAYDDLKRRAFENKLHSADMKEGTLTLTNFGALSGASLGGTPIINAPEAAICGVARIQKMPTVVNNEIVIRDLMNVSFTFDHRLIDGQLAARISQMFCSLLENPAKLL